MSGANLPIGLLDFGKSDARHEIRPDDKNSLDFFYQSFVLQSSVATEDFVSGNRFLIIGLKGTGKTALLTYIKLLCERNGLNTRLVLFNQELSEEDRQSFSMSAGYSLISEPIKSAQSSIEQDFEPSWFWFFHRQIYQLLQEKHRLSWPPSEGRRYLGLLEAIITHSDPRSDWSRWLPRLKNSKVKLGADFPFLKAEFASELEFGDGGIKASISQIIRVLNKEIASIAPLILRTVLFIDEIEVSLGTPEQYARDCKIVRDLVVVIHKMNRMFSELRIAIHIVAGVRSEILNSVHILGKETNKISADFGHRISWHGRDDGYDHPLFEVIRRKVALTERRNNLPSEEIWSRYFPQMIGDEPFWRFLMRKTWYRPRDFVRFLNLAKSHAVGDYSRPDASAFAEADFTSVNKTYSQDSWREIREELQAIFSQKVIAGIGQVFTGFRSRFTIDELATRVFSLGTNFSPVKEVQTVPINDLIVALYRVGMIGNVYESSGRQRNRWAYRGDDDPILEETFAIHNGLRSAFSL